MISETRHIDFVRTAARRLTGASTDYDPLLARIGDARIVLLGEGSHGTHEFYRERARITKRLVRELGFHAVAIEADFPDAQRVSRHVQGRGEDAEAVDALAGFRRFPTWMWRNADVLDFVGWLAAYNQRHTASVGVYGLDLYSLYGSIEAVLRELERIDPAAAEVARGRYACFDHYGEDSERYAYTAGMDLGESCERAVTEQLIELRLKAPEWAARDGQEMEDDVFVLEQNARLVQNAERYYRTMFRGRVESWNLRDQHMFETLQELARHLDRRSGRSKIVVWAHNSHLGDARATDLSRVGELNLGQLVREHFSGESFSVGFTTHHGTVTAASDWDEPPERKTVRPALPSSYESLFHAAEIPRFLLDLADPATERLPANLLQRAIGVIYRPQTERASHYFHADLRRQFDALVHIDETRAVEPLETTQRWTAGEAPETYPFAV